MKNRLEGNTYIFTNLYGKTAAKGFVNSYYNSLKIHGLRRLWDFYKKPSIYKEKAYRECFEIVEDFCTSFTHEDAEIEWEYATIVGGNCMKFTFGCTLYNAETGEVIGVLYITADNNYYLPDNATIEICHI